MVGEKRRALIVDDDSFIRELLAAILEGDGYTVAVAENGTEAFSAFCADPGFGIVISDMNMPDMNGLELIRKIRDRGCDVPAIILTGDAAMTHTADTPNDGSCDILVKDENIQELIGSFVAGAMEKYERKKRQARGISRGSG